MRSLGDQAGAFAVSLAGPGKYAPDEVAAAERAIAGASPLLARGEGGIAHHRNVFPHDPHLRLWAGLISASAGARSVAATEFAAADALGLGGRGAQCESLFLAA